jgi:competence ComEA-like helix-hairpin-helix protein
MRTAKQFSLRIVFSLLCLALCCGPVLAAAPAPGGAAPASEEVDRLELNTATVEQITALGVVTADEAKRIVKYREEMGDFQSYEDLGETGLAKEKIDLLRPKTTVNHMATDCSC